MVQDGGADGVIDRANMLRAKPAFTHIGVIALTGGLVRYVKAIIVPAMEILILRTGSKNDRELSRLPAANALLGHANVPVTLPARSCLSHDVPQIACNGAIRRLAGSELVGRSGEARLAAIYCRFCQPIATTGCNIVNAFPWLRGSEFHYPERPKDLPTMKPLKNWPRFDPRDARG